MKLSSKCCFWRRSLGLLAPMAATRHQSSTDGVNRYADSQEQVTSITQFSIGSPPSGPTRLSPTIGERYGLRGCIRWNLRVAKRPLEPLGSRCPCSTPAWDRITEVYPMNSAG